MKESNIMNMTTTIDQVINNNNQSIQQNQYDNDIELNWDIVHEEICWKNKTLILSINDIIIEYSKSNKNKSYYISTNELPTKNDVVIVIDVITTNDDDQKKKKQYQYTENNINDIVVRFIRYRKQQQQKQKEDIMSSSLSSPTTTKSSSSVVSYTAQLAYHYLIKKPLNVAYEAVIGTSDYVEHLEEFEKACNDIDNNNDDENDNNNIRISSDDNVISLVIIYKALQCLYDIILHVEPIILSNNNNTLLYDWIRSKLVVVTNENNSKNNNNIIQFILDLNNNELDLLILCLKHLYHQNELLNDNHHFVFTNEITIDNETTRRDDIWIIGNDTNQTIEIRIIVYDIDYTIQNIENNMKRWEDIVNQCMNDAIKYKKLNKTDQALNALKRKKLYTVKIESSQMILFNLEQHKFTIESSINDQSILNTFTQTANSLRSIRIDYENSQQQTTTTNNYDVDVNDESETMHHNNNNHFNNDGDDSDLIMELQELISDKTTATTTTIDTTTTNPPSAESSIVVVEDDHETNDILLRLKALSVNMNQMNNKTTTTQKQEEAEKLKEMVTE